MWTKRRSNTRLLRELILKVDTLMATMQDLTASVQREADANDAVILLLTGVSQQLKTAQAQNDPTAIQTVIDQIDANTKKLSDAVTANTPAAPVAPTAPAQ